MEFWQNIYSHFNPVAFNLGPVSQFTWYGIMYALALSAIFYCKIIY